LLREAKKNEPAIILITGIDLSRGAEGRKAAIT